MAYSNTRRVVLLGKTGSGKSSLANTLFGEKAFEVDPSANSCTKVCKSKIKTVNGRSLQLIDTPGFFDTDPRSTDLSPEVLTCITECAPGPHAFLLVLKIEKYTVLEQVTVAMMLKYFSKAALNYTTVVFTRGDDLPENMKIEEWVSKNTELNNLVQRCGGRCHVIDNRYWNNSQDPYRNNQYQLEQILKSIDQTVAKNGGGYYTNDMLQKVSVKIQQTVTQMGKSSPNTSPSGILQKAKEFVVRELSNIGLAIGGLLGGFIGGLAVGALAAVCGAPCVVVFLGVVGGAVLGGALGALAGRAVGKALTPEESEAQRYIKDVDNLWAQLLKVKSYPLQ